MEDRGLESFITIPRKVASDYRNRLLTRQERDVFVWLRLIADPYGKAHVELSGLTADCFGRGVDDNYINKILLSLKRKRYIYYKPRSGHRGSFEVHLGDWPLPRENPSDKLQIKTLDKYFNNAPSVRGESIADTSALSEVRTELQSQSQRLHKENSGVLAGRSSLSQKFSVRGHDNDTDTYKEKQTNISNRSFKEGVSPYTFVPNSHEEERCRDIALELGEHNMSFLLGSMKKHGFRMIERTWNYCRETSGFRNATNKGAYFNSVLQKFASGMNGESQRINHL